VSRPSRWPLVLLGALTLLTVGGPVLIGIVLRGGARRGWPPDRAVEWVAVLGTSGAVAGLMAASIATAAILARRRPPGAGGPA